MALQHCWRRDLVTRPNWQAQEQRGSHAFACLAERQSRPSRLSRAVSELQTSDLTRWVEPEVAMAFAACRMFVGKPSFQLIATDSKSKLFGNGRSIAAGLGQNPKERKSSRSSEQADSRNRRLIICGYAISRICTWLSINSRNLKC